MNIGQVLNQTNPFRNNHEKLMVNLMYSHNWLMNRQGELFKEYDLTLKQYNILRILRGAKKPISNAVIRKRMIDKMSDVSRIIDRLVKKGLVSRATCNADNRKVDVCINDAALALLEEIDSALVDFQKDLINLSEEEAGHLSDMLDTMRTEK